MKFKHWLTALVVGAMGIGLAACSSGHSATPSGSKKLTVVASVNFYGEVAKAVVGNHGTVTSVIDNPDVDPHDYDPTTDVAKSVAKADVIVENGAGYDGWMTRLVDANNTDAKVVSAAKVVGVANGENEHIWYKPKMMIKMANALADRYGKVDPAHKAEYQQNAKAYIKKLTPLTKLIDQTRSKAHGEAVAVSEPVFDNALHYLGYKVVDEHFSKANEDGTDPSPKDIRDLLAAIKGKKIKFFVQNTQFKSPTVSNMVALAKRSGVPVLKVTETMPSGETYISWMTRQYKALEAIQDRR
ncbi:metal ABC transporter solute-binding protein, Zn/Mn family [Lacticaseibacillus camelliae]|uniref:ABC-type metal ion transport system, periplasmic component surface adhesin n=1 Tax=Lacticaseibacillus camelliae DSM 22697 = JCM 13995 TaxID=1423730 RepID=A0A0R2F8Z2_9LACO|nr:zinc ABC transporter substrate-binding protein [Lacticaseibacillus camelliae]KRN21236.1 ABC-type metal ion transport system, periplasmic component surface adhesin [Lacticaseibacillus camelliae DSM 22697 = JCM 13995]